jgi:beta-glucanase (GH16 family)
VGSAGAIAAPLPLEPDGAMVATSTLVAHHHGRRHAHKKHAHKKHGRPLTSTLQKHVRRPGIYKVTIVVTSHTGRRSAVRLEIGKSKKDAKTRGGKTALLHMKVAVRGDLVTIKDVHMQGQATVRVRLVRIAALPKPKAKPKPNAKPGHGLTSGSSGSAGTTSTGSSGTTITGSGVPLVPVGVAGTWHAIFDDEFNQSGLNTSNWSTGWFGSGITGGVSSTEPECYDPSHVVEANDELDLNFTQGVENCNGNNQPYTAGMVTSNGKFSFTYGLIEARVWLPTTSNGQVADWPGVWTDGQNWPADGEIDLVEGLEGQACAHWHGPTGSGAGYGPNGGTGCPAGTYTGGWHTFAADWEPGIVTWYYDGKNIGCIESSGTACGNYNSTITSSPMYLILSLGSDASNTITSPTSMRLQYVRVYQH